MAPTFSGGKLNLKGSKKAKKKYKKSKHKINADAGIANDKRDNETSKQKEDWNGNSNDYVDESDDDLTPAERNSLNRKKQREREELEKLGNKSHRERVEEFNEKLGKLTEHNDIPRVSHSFIVVMSLFIVQNFFLSLTNNNGFIIVNKFHYTGQCSWKRISHQLMQ